MKEIYKIYDIPVEIRIDDEFESGIEKFKQQFDVYEKTDLLPRIAVSVSKGNDKKKILTNPSIHHLIENGFMTNYLKYDLAISEENNLLKFDFFLKSEGNSLLRFLRKINNIQYENIDERIVQLIWENCLYPSVYFLPNRVAIHSSGFSVNNKEGLLLGGTGGSGKTSLEIKLSKQENFGFLNDDIAILDAEGNIYPNASWPKIYAYNLLNNGELKKEIFEQRGIDDKLFWWFKQTFFGKDKVRRTISPEKLFGKEMDFRPKPLKNYVFLSKGNYSELRLRPIEKIFIPQINTSIISSEFAEFENHLKWHFYNSQVNNSATISTVKESHTRWLEMYENIFKNVDCYVLEIPYNITHDDFLIRATEIILSLYK